MRVVQDEGRGGEDEDREAGRSGRSYSVMQSDISSFGGDVVLDCGNMAFNSGMKTAI